MASHIHRELLASDYKPQQKQQGQPSEAPEQPAERHQIEEKERPARHVNVLKSLSALATVPEYSLIFPLLISSVTFRV